MIRTLLRTGLCALATGMLTAVACAALAECPVVPPPVSQVRSTNIYGEHGSLQSRPDKQAQSERNELVRPLSQYAEAVAKQADAYQASKDPADARCASRDLESWAAARAMLTEPDNEAARKDIIWHTAGLSLAYLRIKPAAAPDQARVIEGWLSQLGESVVARYSRSKRKDNVHAWAGLVGVAVGAATSRPDLMATGGKMQEAVLAGVDANGVLKPELERGRRALAYHNYAAAPLLVGQLVRERYGTPMPPHAQAALSRLAAFTLRATEDRSLLERVTSLPQDDPSGRMHAVVVALSPAARGLVPRSQAFEKWFGGGVAFFLD